MNDLIKIVISAIILVFSELLYFIIAMKYGITDKPNQRSSHIIPTIRGGGIIFYVGAIVWGLLFNGFYANPFFLLGLILIGGISFVDDVHSVPNRYRILVHFIAILLLLFECALLNFCGWNILLSLVAIVVATGIINAFNFMDGVNGITGAYSLAVLLPLLYLNNNLEFVSNSLIVIVIISLLVFSIFNFRKRAKCFAGDVGSVTIAYIIVFLLGCLIAKTHDFTYIFMLLVYGVDTTMTLIHRLYLKENIFEAHREHVYQLLANELKIPHLVVAMSYMLLQLIINIGIVLFNDHSVIIGVVAFILLSIAYWVIIMRFFSLHRSK